MTFFIIEYIYDNNLIAIMSEENKNYKIQH